MKQEKDNQEIPELEYIIEIDKDYKNKESTRSAIESNPEIEIVRKFQLTELYHIRIKTDNIPEGAIKEDYIENKINEISDIEGVHSIRKVLRDYKALDEYINQDQQPC